MSNASCAPTLPDDALGPLREYTCVMANTLDSKLSELEQRLAHAALEDMEAERLKRKQRLACGLRTMGRLHLAEGVPGHVTVRDPEHLDRFWVNPFGTNFKLMKVSDLICVDHDGNVVEGDGPLNAGRIRHPRPDPSGPAGHHRRCALALDVRQDLLDARQATQDDHAGQHDVLQRRRAVQRGQRCRRTRSRKSVERWPRRSATARR